MPSATRTIQDVYTDLAGALRPLALGLLTFDHDTGSDLRHELADGGTLTRVGHAAVRDLHDAAVEAHEALQEVLYGMDANHLRSEDERERMLAVFDSVRVATASLYGLRYRADDAPDPTFEVADLLDTLARDVRAHWLRVRDYEEGE